MEIDKFRAFEHAGWQNVPHQYDRAWGTLTSQKIPALLDAVGAKDGVKLLDIATGPGYVAAAAARRGAIVTAIDFSAAMIAQAQRSYPNIEFREANAEQMPFGDLLFDAAVMNFGILHLAQPERALSEACRIIRSGGRFAFTAWAKPDETVGFRIVLQSIEQHGDLKVTLPEGPPFFRFSEPAECERALLAAGFKSPEVIRVPQIWRLPAGDGLFEAMKEGTVRTAGLLREQKPAALIEIRDAIRKKTDPYQRGEIMELPMPAILASATKN